MKAKFLKIIKHYGVNHQQRKLEEEVFELQEAITLYEWDHKMTCGADAFYHKEHIVEEIADVCVMLHQFVEYYRITPVEIYRFMEQKIGRQIERIKNESNRFIK